MMPPKATSFIAPTPAAPYALVPPIVVPGEDSEAPAHTDYDLRPLTVLSLGHYVAEDEETERFHIR